MEETNKFDLRIPSHGEQKIMKHFNVNSVSSKSLIILWLIYFLKMQDVCSCFKEKGFDATLF